MARNTLAQVVCKMDDAKRRSLASVEKAMSAATNDEYCAHLSDACKAADDYKIWRMAYERMCNTDTDVGF